MKKNQHNNKCKECSGKMKKGLAMANTYVGIPDFAGCEVMTVSYGGSGKLIAVDKCTRCGWSMSL